MRVTTEITSIVLFLFHLCSDFCFAKEIEIWNRLGGTIWVGAQANRGFPLPDGGGWIIENKEEKIKIQVPDNWSGRFWARTWCNVSGDNTCQTGGCETNFECRGLRGSSPASMAEFTFSTSDVDQYSVSFVHGFNAMVRITPVNVEIEPDDDVSCKQIDCDERYYDQTCPTELQLRNELYIIGCHSACSAFKTDEYCCKENYKKYHLCKPSNWPKNYAKMLKEKCPQLKTYLYDNDNVVHKCQATGYLVTFNQPLG